MATPKSNNWERFLCKTPEVFDEGELCSTSGFVRQDIVTEIASEINGILSTCTKLVEELRKDLRHWSTDVIRHKIGLLIGH